jgi:hypothetical protein
MVNFKLINWQSYIIYGLPSFSWNCQPLKFYVLIQDPIERNLPVTKSEALVNLLVKESQ